MLLSVQKVKEIYSISRRTLINWEKEGLITPLRTPKGRRRYRKEDIEKLLGMIEEKPKPTVVLYARVSTKKQEEYLKNQIRRLEEYANLQGWRYEVISEIASGVNENRRGLLKLLNKIKRGEVQKVVIEHPDRLARFGFEYLKQLHHLQPGFTGKEVVKSMITIQAKLTFPSEEDEQIVLDLMRRWSSCTRFAYNRLLEGKSRNTLKKELQGIFNLNSRYVDDAIMKAKSVLESCKERDENPSKVIFGGRSLFDKLKKRHINGKAYKKLKQEWQERRKGNLYSRGDRSKKGNLNTRMEIDGNCIWLRINAGERKYAYARIQAGWKKSKSREGLLEAISTCGEPYSVELKLKNGKVYAYFTIEEDFPEAVITKENGVIGIDINAYPNNVAWAEADGNGQLVSYGKIPMPELASGSSDKREYYRWQYAHEVVRLAEEKEKAIAIERLDIRDKGRRGDFSGRKSRRIRHNFSYRSLLEKLKILAQRKGIQVIEVNPAYTSVIGMLKYAPQYMISKDIAASYVIARRGLGLREQIPEGYMAILKDLDADELEELKEHVKRTVKNKQLKKRQLKEIDRAIKLIKSLGSEPEKVSRPLDGTSLGAYSASYKLWRVLKVAVVTPLSPERVLRDVSVLKEVLHSGQVGRPG